MRWPFSPAPTRAPQETPALLAAVGAAMAQDDPVALEHAYRQAGHALPLSGPALDAGGKTGVSWSSLLCWSIMDRRQAILEALARRGVSWQASANAGVDPVVLALSRVADHQASVLSQAQEPADLAQARQVADAVLKHARPLGVRYMDASHTTPLLVGAMDGLFRPYPLGRYSWELTEQLLEAGADPRQPTDDSALLWGIISVIGARRLRDLPFESDGVQRVVQRALQAQMPVQLRSSRWGFAGGTVFHAMVGNLAYAFDLRPRHAQETATTYLTLIPALIAAGADVRVRARALATSHRKRPGKRGERLTAAAWGERLGGEAARVAAVLRTYEHGHALAAAMEQVRVAPPVVENEAVPARRRRL